MNQETTSHNVSRREFLGGTGGLLTAIPALALDESEKQASVHKQDSPPMPRHQRRPAWWREEGLVMAGVDWESLLTRLRAGSYDSSQAFMSYDEKMAIWSHEHSEELAQRLKERGFNFVMIPLYKGGGPKAERASMEAAKRFTQICHRLGLRVGCYASSGTILYETMLAEDPEAKDWYTLDQNGKPMMWGALYYRYWANRIHPGFRALLRAIVHFAVEEAKVDLVHFDNYVVGPSYEAYSVNRFREYLMKKYSAEERMQRFGSVEMDYTQPPPSAPTPDRYNGDPLYQDFIDFRCQSMADTFRELADYGRSLNPEVVMEFNANGYDGELVSSMGIGTVDHTLMLPWSGAFWDEGDPSRMEKGIVYSHFRTYLLGRYYNNMVFNYTAEPISIAECMANNLQCLGCPCWVTGDQINPATVMRDPEAKEFHPAVLASIRFFHREQEHFRDTEGIADVGVLNTYANTAYGPHVSRQRWAAFTQALYQSKVPFTIVPDRHPGDLSRFRVLALPDLALISDELLEVIWSYVHAGGTIVMTGQTALFTEKNVRRKRRGLSDLFTKPLADTVLHATPGRGRAVYVPQIVIPSPFHIGMLPHNRVALLEAIRWAVSGSFQVEIAAPETVAMSLYAQPSGHRILHLVNYAERHTVFNIEVTLQLPADNSGTTARLLSPDFEGERPLKTKQSGRSLSFTVPQLNVYCMVVIS